MAQTAENLATKYHISRQAVDCYAARSQAAAAAGWEAGAFSDEVVPVSIQNRKTKQAEDWAADEHMRPGTTPEALAKLPPYFKKDGVVTAGNFVWRPIGSRHEAWSESGALIIAFFLRPNRFLDEQTAQ